MTGKVTLIVTVRSVGRGETARGLEAAETFVLGLGRGSGGRGEFEKYSGINCPCW